MKTTYLKRPLAAALLAGALVAGPSAMPAAAQPAGIATDVNSTTRIQDAAGTAVRFLEPRGDVFIGDHISTDRSGQAQIRFADETRMVVGPNSQITIDRFVFDTATTASEVVIDTVRGAFRFITGRSSKDAYLIRLPVGTIGVRGTELDITVEEDNTTKIVLWSGAALVCDTAENTGCTQLTDACDMLIVHPDRSREGVRNVYERTDILDRDFPYAFAQRRIDRSYWVHSRGCNMRDYTGAPAESTGDPGTGRSNVPSTPPIIIE